MRPPVARALLVAAALTYLAAAFRIDTPEDQYAAVGPGVFPMIIGLGLVGCASWVAATDRTTSPLDWRGVGGAAATYLAYLALLPMAGFLPATVPFVVLQARVLGSQRWRRDLVVAALLATTVHGLLTFVLGVQLPQGLLG